MFLLEPEELSLVQLFWLCLVGVLVVFTMCQWLNMLNPADMIVL